MTAPQAASRALQFALAYRARGWLPIPVPLHRKAPTIKGWQDLRLTKGDLPVHFNNGAMNVGVLTGEPSGGLIDIDLDCREALTLADALMMPTESIFGRPGNPHSHRLYRSSGVCGKIHKFVGAAGEKLVEYRATGGQTIFPGSVHESGERVEWEIDGEPQHVEAGQLLRATEELAAACLLVQHYPAEGSRHDFALALAGGLLRCGWAVGRAEHFIAAIVNAAGDREVHDRTQAVRTTKSKLDNGAAATGFRRLSDYMDGRAVDKVREWLGGQDSPATSAPKKTANASQANELIQLVTDAKVELFHDAVREAYASVPVGSHSETWPVKSRTFKHWLAGRYYQHAERVPNSQAMLDAIGVLEGRAIFGGPEYAVHVRVAEHEGRIYLDLANDDWEVVEVAAERWRVIAQAPVKFRQTAGMLPLPIPARGGSVDELRPFINVHKNSDFALLISYLVAALRPSGPYPVLDFGGSHGAAKTTGSRFIRRLIDPNACDLRTPPRDARDAAIAASNSWIFALDNVSDIRQWLSDVLCRLATGGGFATRMLYTDEAETLFRASRPVLLNGIGDVVTSPDLLDRTIQLNLAEIPRDRRRPEKELLRDFDKARPRILGALLDAVSTALRTVDSIKLAELPRMADFAVWAVAAESALPWKSGTFLRAYTANQNAGHELAVEASPIGEPVIDLVQKGRVWEGTATALMETLREQAGHDLDRPPPKGWPQDPARLGKALRRLAPSLRGLGVAVEFDLPGRRRGISIGLVDGRGTGSDGNRTPQPSGENGPGWVENADPDGADSADGKKPNYQVGGARGLSDRAAGIVEEVRTAFAWAGPVEVVAIEDADPPRIEGGAA